MTAFNFKPGMQEQLTLFSNSPDAGDPDCICSYCSELIEEDDSPIRFFIPESEKYPDGAEYRLHVECANQVVDWESVIAEGSVVVEGGVPSQLEEPEEDFGPCCACGQETTRQNPVRNIMMLEKKATVPGTGWGCVICHLPFDGASAILCDRCLESNAKIRFAIDGHLPEKKRVPISQLQGEHKHDMKVNHG